jgi:glycosyltransferase involved in cell wall biosynthesis
MFPSPYTDSTWMRESHPLLLEIANQLEKLGCKCIKTPNFPFLFWIFLNRRDIDILHVHWPELYYELQFSNPVFIKISGYLKFLRPLQHWLGLIWLFNFIGLLQLLKIPLVWTLHDLFPHASQSPSKLQRFTRKYLLQHTQALLLNCQGVEPLVRQNVGDPRNVTIAPLGDYKLFYPDTIQRDEARRFFNLNPAETMFLFFGSQRPHRNAQELIQIFKKIEDPALVLWIIGYTPDDIRSTIEDLSWADWRIHHYLNHASNMQIEYALKACDFLVMPGKKYLTSAVISLALSYGIPVIAPRYGCAEGMVRDAGVLYDDTQTDGLEKALGYALEHKTLLQQRAREQMSRWSWTSTAQQIYKAYQTALEEMQP